MKVATTILELALWGVGILKQKEIWLSRREPEQRGDKEREHGGRIVKRDVSHVVQILSSIMSCPF